MREFTDQELIRREKAQKLENKELIHSVIALKEQL